MNIEKKDIKYLNFNCEIKNIINEDPDFFQVTGYASTFGNIDRGDDVIAKGAFVDSIREFTPKFLWQHDMEMPLGVLTEVYEDEKGLYFKAKLPREDSFVKGRVIPQVGIGSIDSLSIGFSVIDADLEKTLDNKTIRTIKKVKLWEISLVTLPMNAEAMVTDSKSAVVDSDLSVAMIKGKANLNAAWNPKEALERVKEFTKSTDCPTDSYKNAFICHDSTNKDSFDSYKHLIADVVDDELVVIPRAIFSATVDIKNSIKRSGTQYSENIINMINSYYKKMDRVSPFEKGFSPLIDSFDTMKDISFMLKSFGFSNNESNSIISSVKKLSDKQAEIEAYRDGLRYLSSSIKEFSDIIRK